MDHEDDLKSSIVDARLYVLEDKVARAGTWKRSTIWLGTFVILGLTASVVGLRVRNERLSSEDGCRDVVKMINPRTFAPETEPARMACDHPRHRGTIAREEGLVISLTCACR